MGADIGANLLDGMYQGEYHGTAHHEPDLDAVLERAWAAGVEKIIITAGTLAESRRALDLARTDERLFCTVGVHPTRSNEFEDSPDGAEGHLRQLQEVWSTNTAARHGPQQRTAHAAHRMSGGNACVSTGAHGG